VVTLVGLMRMLLVLGVGHFVDWRRVREVIISGIFVIIATGGKRCDAAAAKAGFVIIPIRYEFIAWFWSVIACVGVLFAAYYCSIIKTVTHPTNPANCRAIYVVQIVLPFHALMRHLRSKIETKS
jgi:hypothetical protein